MSQNENLVNHRYDCPVTIQRLTLLEELANEQRGWGPEKDEDRVAELLGAAVEYYNGGDQEAEGCTCGGYERMQVQEPPRKIFNRFRVYQLLTENLDIEGSDPLDDDQSFMCFSVANYNGELSWRLHIYHKSGGSYNAESHRSR